MALQTPTPSASYAQSATYVLSLSPVVDAILLDDADLLATLGFGEAVTQTKHEWDEDALNGVTIKASANATSGAMTSAGTILLISAGYQGRVTAGTLLRDQLSGKTEVLMVTARSGVSATVVRGYGSTSPETHAHSATWDIVANARPEGMEGPADESTARSRPYNYTQIFSKGVKLTGTAEAITHNGIPDEATYQIDMRQRELLRELDRTVIMGIRGGPVASTPTYGTMGGLIEYIKATGGNISTTAETLTPTVVNDLLYQIWADGGSPTHIVVGGVQKRKFANFDKEYRRTTIDSRRSGFTVDEFVSDLGVALPIIVDRWVPNDTMLVIDASRIKIKPLSGRGFFLGQLAKTGDSDKWQIVGEYTLEIKNALTAHGIHTNLKQ